MDGLTVNDLYNLTNTGNVRAQNGVQAWVSAQANVHQPDTYSWRVWAQPDGQAAFVVSNTAQQPGMALVEDGQLVYSTVDKDKKQTRLYSYDLQAHALQSTVNLAGHQLRVVEYLGENRFLLNGRTPRKEALDAKPWHEVNEVPYWSNDEGVVNATRRHLWLFDGNHQQLTDLLPADFDCMNYWWQDGHLLVNGASYQGVRPFKDGLYEYDFDQQKLVELVAPGKYRVDTVAWLKGQLYVVASNCKVFGMGENPNFYRYSGQTLHLVAKWDHNVGNILVNDMTVVGGRTALVGDDQLYFCSTVVDHTEVHCFDGQHLTLAFSWAGGVNSLAFQDHQLLFAATTATEPQQLYSFHAGDFKQLTAENQFLKQRKVAKMHEVSYNDSTGRECHGWVLYPVNYEKGQQYPGVLEVHGGPRAAYGTSFFHEMQVLANAGYFVFLTNLHGSEGQGDEYADLRGRYGQVDYDDLMTFVDAVLQQYPDVDPERLGVTGGSYGGFMTNWVVGHTHRFKAAVSERSIATWSSMMISDIGPEFVTDQMATSLSQADGMKTFWQHSPLAYMNNVQTPTLFLHSDHDFRCPIPEGYQMFQALKLKDVPTRMVVFHGSNHDLSRDGRPDQRAKRLNEVLTWFNQYLK